MVTTYNINGNVTATTKAEMLADMDWFTTTYPTKLASSNGSKEGFFLSFYMTAIDYNDMKTILAALETQFNTRITWSFNVS